MGRIDWFFEHEAEYFATRLQKLVLELHEFAGERLDGVYSKEIEEAERDEALDADNCADYQRYLRREQIEQQRALSTMALTMLASLIESFLDEARTRLDQNAFPSAKTYRGKSKLLRRITEYEERFRIDLTSLPGFDALREVVLARNSCVHENGHPSADYLAQTQHRFLEEVGVFQSLDRNFKDEDRFIRCNVEILRGVAAEVSEFAMALHTALNAVRGKHRSKDQASDASRR
jgi:hypothetical protein